MNVEERIRALIEAEQAKLGGFNLKKFVTTLPDLVTYDKVWKFLNRGTRLGAIEAEIIEQALTRCPHCVQETNCDNCNGTGRTK